MLIMKKVRLVNPVVPVIPTGLGTFLVVDATASRTFGITTGTLAAGSESVTVDWGDGERETIVGDIDRLSHAYAKPGQYVVSVSDDIQGFGVGKLGSDAFVTVYAPMIRECVSRGKLARLPTGAFRHAPNMTRLDLTQTVVTEILTNAFAKCTGLTSLDGLPRTLSRLVRACFLECTGLTGRVNLPGVSEIVVTTEATLPFSGCTNIAEIHFAAANEEAIKATTAWSLDPKLGAANAAVYFDL